MNHECVFCSICLNKKDFIGESENFFAIKDIHPKVKGHTLIISKKHYNSFSDIPSILGNELIEFVKEMSSFLSDSDNGEGFNLILNNGSVAGQVINHMHLHVLPRKKNDSFKNIV